MTAFFNQQIPFPLPDTGGSGGISTAPKPTPPTELPVAGTAGPADGVYEIRNVGLGLELIAPRGRRGVAFVATFAISPANRWKLIRVGDVFRIKQRATGRFVESHPTVVLTTEKSETRAGMWASDGPILSDAQPVNITHLAPHPNGTALGEQFDGNCFVGAEVTIFPNWIAERDAQGLRLRSRRTDLYLDAHVVNGFRVVTRPRQNNATQIFDVEIIGGVYLLRHESGLLGNFLDAFDRVAFDAFTTPGPFGLEQKWAIIERSPGNHTIQQTSSGRLLSLPPQELVGFEPEIANTVWTANSDSQQFTLNRRGR